MENNIRIVHQIIANMIQAAVKGNLEKDYGTDWSISLEDILTKLATGNYQFIFNRFEFPDRVVKDETEDGWVFIY